MNGKKNLVILDEYHMIEIKTWEIIANLVAETNKNVLNELKCSTLAYVTLIFLFILDGKWNKSFKR